MAMGLKSSRAGWAGPDCHILLFTLPLIKGGVFSEPMFFLRTCPARPIRDHTRSAITRRLCGWQGASGTQGLRALRLWESGRQWRAQPWTSRGRWSCMDAAPGCRLQRRSAPQPQHIDGVARAGSLAQAPRAGRARSLLGPAHHVGAHRREPHAVQGPATARRPEANLSIIAVCDQSCRTDHLGRPCM